MKTLYIECKMGAAGDMIMGALYELLDSEHKQKFINMMNTLFGSDIHIHPIQTTQYGIAGTHMDISVIGKKEHANNSSIIEITNPNGDSSVSEDTRKYVEITTGHIHTHSLGKTAETAEHHEHYTYASILRKLKILPLPESIRENATSIYKTIGEAEASVHDVDLKDIHFHEVGSMDAIADVLGCCILFSMINADQVIVSPIHVGNGVVECQHGILPVPAPATAEILKGIPYYTGSIDSELCTPTGAAILRHYATRFSTMPIMTVAKSGIGFGSKEFPVANAVRTFLGETMNIQFSTKDAQEENSTDDEKVIELLCNIDDMTGEEIGFVMDMLFQNGALDVYYQPIQMKKNRPGIMLSCLTKMDKKEDLTNILLKYTSTRGVRFHTFGRTSLESKIEEIPTKYGTIHKKISYGHGIEKYKYEYEDIKEIAIKNDISIDTLLKELYSENK